MRSLGWAQLLWIAFLVAAAVMADTTPKQGVEAVAQAPEAPAFVTGFPRNITDIYRGTWAVDAHATDLEAMSWRFEHFTGQYLMHVATSQAGEETEDRVQGYFELRDGIYSTDDVMRYRIAGAYVWEEGLLLLAAVPLENEELIHDLGEIVKDKNRTDVRFPDHLEAMGLFEEQSDGACPLRLTMRVMPLSEFEVELLDAREVVGPHQRNAEDPLILMDGSLSSPNCAFHLTLTDGGPVILAEYYTKALHYVMIVTVITIAQMLLVSYQLEATNTPATAAKVSMAMVGMQAVIDSYICLFHLSLGIFIEATLNAFVTASLFKFIMFSVFEMRYLLLIWKSRRPVSDGADWNEMRNQLRALYTRIYLCLLAGFLVLYFLSTMIWVFVLVLYSFWVPQIICNATRAETLTMRRRYVVGMTMTRLVVPTYFYVCPNNFLHIGPNPVTARLLVCWLGLQVVFLMLQDVYGPRFFIPKKYLPTKYDYFRRVCFEPGQEKECVICMCNVDPSEMNYMVTPCDHIFHATCLEQWLGQKMQCPTCRRKIPEP